MDTTNNIGLSKPDYNSIADIEVINENSDIIDEQFSPSKWVKTVNGVAPVNHNVTVDTGVTSFNGAKGAITYTERTVKQLIDIIYPVGCYFDTTNTSFNPNVSWGGTWEKVTDGRALIAGGGAYNVGTNYGDSTHKLTVAELPSHNHSASVADAGSHTHTGSTSSSGEHNHNVSHYHYTGYQNNNNGGWSLRVSDISANTKIPVSSFNMLTWNGSGGGDGYTNDRRMNIITTTAFSTSIGDKYYSDKAGNHTHTLSISTVGNHKHTVTIGNTGSNLAFNLLPPSTAVARWHRIA